MKNILSMLIVGIILTNGLFADKRSFVWTYESIMLTPGEVEFEAYYTSTVFDMENRETTTSVLQEYELEMGMSQYFDFSIYQRFRTNPGEGVTYEGFKFRSRVDAFNSELMFLQPLLYLEYKSNPQFTSHEFELKLILNHRSEKYNISFNPIMEWENDSDGWERKWGYAFGAGYIPYELFGFGMEMTGDKNAQYAGPMINHGKSDLWVTLSTGFRIAGDKNNTPDFKMRLILGVGL